MAKPIKIWTGSEWVDVAIQSPSVSGLATTSALTAHEADTTNVHGITDTSQLATQTYVNTQVANLVNSAPAALDTLDELAQALGDDANFATTVTNALAGKEKFIPLQNTAPSSPSTSDLWVDNTDPTKPVLKVYNGSAWVVAGSSVTADDDQIILASRVFT